MERNRRASFQGGRSDFLTENTIAVHPKHPNHILCGGVDLHLTTNAAKRGLERRGGIPSGDECITPHADSIIF